jgi:hypothetical protein
VLVIMKHSAFYVSVDCVVSMVSCIMSNSILTLLVFGSCYFLEDHVLHQDLCYKSLGGLV